MDVKVYFVYLLESLKSGIWYVGLSENPHERIKQHNKGKSKFTKGHIPWKLLYIEKVGELKLAREKEKYYKTASGKRKLKQILNDMGREFPV